MKRVRGQAVWFCMAALWIAGVIITQGCKHEAGSSPSASVPANWEQSLKDGVVGDWEEIHGTHEMLSFGSDGMLEMKSPREHRNCHYDFPDYEHIRLDCAVPGVPSNPQTWKISVTSDTLKISDNLETGTYKRREAGLGSEQPQSGR